MKILNGPATVNGNFTLYATGYCWEGGVKIITISQETYQDKMHINLPGKGDARIILFVNLSVNSYPIEGESFLV